MRKSTFFWSFILLTTLSLSVSFISNNEFFYNLSCNNQTSNYTPELLIKNSGYWVLNGISIDGLAHGVGAHNWTWVEHQEWFGGGSGTKEDPYIIENITINKNESGDYCIKIVNSQVFFEIRNCTCTYGRENGIRLINVRNAKIINSSCSNNYNGIYLKGSNNITIIKNNISDNNLNGILIENSYNCIIKNNSIALNGFNPYWHHMYFPENKPYGGGIAFWTSDNNSITSNQFNSNKHFGIALGFTIGYHQGFLFKEPSCGNFISKNVINEGGGIWIKEKSNYTQLKENILTKSRIRIGHCFHTNMTENKLFDSYLYLYGEVNSDSSHIIDTTNKINERPICYIVNKSGGILTEYSGAGMLLLVNCNNSEISNMNFSSSAGILMRYCFNNSVDNNQFYNTSFGIDCIYCTYNNIRNNLIRNSTSSGIFLYYCNYNNISQNHIKIAEYGIDIAYSKKNNIYQNHISIADYGILLFESIGNNTISQNHISIADFGIYLWYYSNNNIVTYNYIYDTNISIYLVDSSHNYVKNNTIVNSEFCILEEGECIGNIFEDNSCNETPELPPDSILGYNLFILIFSIIIIVIILYIEKNSRFPQKGT